MPSVLAVTLCCQHTQLSCCHYSMVLSCGLYADLCQVCHLFYSKISLPITTACFCFITRTCNLGYFFQRSWNIFPSLLPLSSCLCFFVFSGVSNSHSFSCKNAVYKNLSLLQWTFWTKPHQSRPTPSGHSSLLINGKWSILQKKMSGYLIHLGWFFSG